MSPSVATSARIAGFVAALLVVFAGAWLVGDRLGPVGASPAPEHAPPTPADATTPTDRHGGAGDDHD